MKKFWLLAVVVVGCAAPSAPTTWTPKHHNVVATFEGQPEGPLVWLCATRPRLYDGHLEEDHYLSYRPCPVVPIE